MQTIHNFETLKEARSFFKNESCPQIVDYYNVVDRYAGRHGPARVVEFNGSREATHHIQCPNEGLDEDDRLYAPTHDCWRCGCGREYMDDWYESAEVQLYRKGEWIVVMEYSNWFKGGIGF